MSDAAALNRRLGIELGYVDQVGKRKSIPAATVEQLWRTLLPGEGGVEPRRLLAELDAEEAGRIVEPVVVATAGAPALRLALNLPRSGKVLHWGITAENGDFWSGQQRLPEPPVGRSKRRRLAFCWPVLGSGITVLKSMKSIRSASQRGGRWPPRGVGRRRRGPGWRSRPNRLCGRASRVWLWPWEGSAATNRRSFGGSGHVSPFGPAISSRQVADLLRGCAPFLLPQPSATPRLPSHPRHLARR